MRAGTDDVSFAVVRRGYDRDQVAESLSRLTAQLDGASTARDAALEDARSLARQLEAARGEAQAAHAANAEIRNELNQMRIHVAELSTIPSTVDGMSERLQQMVRIAQDEMNDMRTRATQSAAQVLTLAQAEADELRERSLSERAAFEAERRTAEESLHAQLVESQTRLDQLRNDSDGQRARLDAELAERRSQVEAEFAAEMDERRAALASEFAAQEARHRTQAAVIVDAATTEARTRLAEATQEAQRLQAEARNDVAAAQRELEELRNLQHQVSEQLTSVRALLDWTLPQIAASGVRPTGNGGQPPATPISSGRPRHAGVEPGNVPATGYDTDGRPDATTAIGNGGAIGSGGAIGNAAGAGPGTATDRVSQDLSSAGDGARASEPHGVTGASDAPADAAEDEGGDVTVAPVVPITAGDAAGETTAIVPAARRGTADDGGTAPPRPTPTARGSLAGSPFGRLRNPR